tara:strand:- start:93 stop:764 length:672 start_codon:yes stop_codon:yes gene_type:complete
MHKSFIRNNLNSLNRFSNKGFTIIELIVSIVIIGILSSLAVPSALKWVDKEKQNSYIRELISFFELVKKETRRWNGSCTLQTNSFHLNPYDNSVKKWQGVEGFNISCVGMDASQKKNISSLVPRIDHKVFQEVNVMNFSFTPKGHLSIPLKQQHQGLPQSNELVIIIGGKPQADFYQTPKCIVIQAPIGMINSGIYQNNMRFYSGRYGSRVNSRLRKQTCAKL